GTVGALVSPGATGKTMLALQAAVTVSGGPDMLDFASMSGPPDTVTAACNASMVLPVAPGLTSAPTVPDLKP
ncbi:helicase RepA family protein, partial [Aeromonas caviae]|uniref:helicase RepA family protein n=1 Tax=Aeromonas caviae TaxID=648 RepID=UPI001CC7F3DE